MVWKLRQIAKEAEARADNAAQAEAMYIAKFLREQSADIMGNAIAGVGNTERCDAASEVLEMAAEMIEKGEYKK